MDKNNIRRYYTIYQVEMVDGGSKIPTLYQQTQLEGEYGLIQITCLCQLEASKPFIHCSIDAANGTPSEKLFSIRNAELAHFVLNILPLFNPLTFNKDALPFQEKE